MPSLDNTNPRAGKQLDLSVWLSKNVCNNPILPSDAAKEIERIIRQYAFDSGLIDVLPDAGNNTDYVRLMDNLGRIRYVDREAYDTLMLDIRAQIDLGEIVI